jgi:hypothetical protein
MSDVACSLTITLPASTTVRTVLLSGRDLNRYENGGKGLTVTVGDTLVTSNKCYFNNDPTQTSSTTGLSAWLTCDNLVGSKLFLTNPRVKMVILFEVMAFTQYNVLPFV